MTVWQELRRDFGELGREIFHSGPSLIAGLFLAILGAIYIYIFGAL